MKPLAEAAIVAVGSELLTPSRLDTNSLFITEQLNRIGIGVRFKCVAGDDRDDLARLCRDLLARVDLVVFSGGLGPTDDDVTREAIAAALGRALSEDAGLAARIEARFVARGFRLPMPAINRRQAMVPEGARVIPNAHGSAPGLWLEDADRVVILLPGPPRELRPMLMDPVLDWLRARASGLVLARRILRIVGRIESEADEALQPLYRDWAAATPPVAATILAALGQLELHLSVRAASPGVAERALAAAAASVVERLGADVFTTEGQTLPEVVGELLVARGLRIALAESCTGGLATSRLTDVPGSSRYVDRAVVVYSNDAKIALLGVPAELIAVHGAVSEEVARAMASGVRQRAAVDVAVGITGIAGPAGGTDQKPVGTVAIAAEAAGAARTRMFRFGGEREHVKFQASQAALDMVRRMLLGA